MRLHIKSSQGNEAHCMACVVQLTPSPDAQVDLLAPSRPADGGHSQLKEHVEQRQGEQPGKERQQGCRGDGTLVLPGAQCAAEVQSAFGGNLRCGLPPYSVGQQILHAVRASLY